MLCPEVWNFSHPKILASQKENADLNAINKIVNMNNFYESLTITIADETQLPNSIKETLTVDRAYYKITQCSLSVFLETEFIENFVKRGYVTCLSIGKQCIVDNCAAITPDGVLRVHVIDFIFQCLGIEGTKGTHNFYDLQIDLTGKLQRKVHNLNKLGLFDFYITWTPHDDNICPSSIAKYLFDRNINVSAHSPKVKHVSPSISEIPSTIDVDLTEIVEWIGMLVHDCDMTPEHDYISSYSQPVSENAIKTNRIAVSHATGYFTPDVIQELCESLHDYVKGRDADNYWVSLSMQTFNNSLWRWDYSCPNQFRYHDSSSTVFFSSSRNSVCSIGQIKL